MVFISCSHYIINLVFGIKTCTPSAVPGLNYLDFLMNYIILLTEGDHTTRPLAAAWAQQQRTAIEQVYSAWLSLLKLTERGPAPCLWNKEGLLHAHDNLLANSEQEVSTGSGWMARALPTRGTIVRAQGHSHKPLGDQLQLVRRWQKNPRHKSEALAAGKDLDSQGLTK